MKCKICSGPSEPLFTAQVLGRHDVAYFRCGQCGFIQTEQPFWLAEAYTEPVSVYDVWAVSRPLNQCAHVANLIDRYFGDSPLPFLDFGGGTGLFARRMRDLGYPFLRSDAYSPNLYARFFDITDHPNSGKFSLITCFEVFEHLPNPLDELTAMFGLGDTIFFSTNLVPAGVKAEKDWDYFAPFHGQHVSFYTVAALQELARATGSRLFTNGADQHLLTRANLRLTQPGFEEIVSGRPSNLLRRAMQKAGHAMLRLSRWPSKRSTRESLTWTDFLHVRDKRRAPPEAGTGVVDK